MLHLNEIEDFDFIALVTEVLAHGLVQFGLGIGYDDRLPASGRLKDQIAGNGA